MVKLSTVDTVHSLQSSIIARTVDNVKRILAAFFSLLQCFGVPTKYSWIFLFSQFEKIDILLERNLWLVVVSPGEAVLGF